MNAISHPRPNFSTFANTSSSHGGWESKKKSAETSVRTSLYDSRDLSVEFGTLVGIELVGLQELGKFSFPAEPTTSHPIKLLVYGAD